MGFEAAPPNDFRATLRSGRRAEPVIAKQKRRETDPKAARLGDIKVNRTESRSSNQRNGDRHRLSDEQATVRRKGKSHVVELINLSHGGAMVAGSFRARLWDKVKLVLGAEGKSGGTGEIECAVRWIRGDRFGLEFAHETRVECDSATFEELLRQVIRNSFPGVEVTAPPTAPEPPEQKRADERHPLIWNGILHHDYDWEVVRLRNISASGALIECSVTLPVGVTVYLDLEGAGRIGANVSWSRGSQSGLAFHEPFDIRSLAKLKPEVAARQGSRPHFGGEGNSDQSPWAPQWGRLSVDELGKRLG
jgi:hypothetical protein